MGHLSCPPRRLYRRSHDAGIYARLFSRPPTESSQCKHGLRSLWGSYELLCQFLTQSYYLVFQITAEVFVTGPNSGAAELCAARREWRVKRSGLLLTA
jgi:hypothetical protein